VVSVWAGTSGFLDDVPVEDIGRFEDEFLDFLQRSHAGIYEAIRETGQLSGDTATALKDAIEEFRSQFQTSAGHLLVGDDEEGDAGESSPSQDAVKKYVPKPDAKPAGQ
jgi:F-type H+/Na+-transporting ATPase subunit alpha